MKLWKFCDLSIFSCSFIFAANVAFKPVFVRKNEIVHTHKLLPNENVADRTKCVVSRWKGWSDCEGSCEFAQRFRNRDVVRPPFPAKDGRTGEFVLSNCPHLYEVERCMPKTCGDESPFAKGPPITHIKRAQSRFSASSQEEDEEANEERTQRIGTSKQLNVTKQDQQQMKRKKLAGIGIHAGRANRLECDYQNSNCCKIVRSTCPHGAKPTSSLIRWYRKKDDQFCRPYRYAVCIDVNEDAFASENECLDACFSDVEKAVLPAFRII
uniref:BPTI/Kunitz inhibitor domain-containing protein n=1 Tax=Globodera rostochiensis TaxID=31243 RepID=A0A914H639_GLORO